MFYKEAPKMLCQLMPDIHVHDHRLRWSVRSHDLAVEVPRSNLASHARSFYQLRPNYGILFLPRFQPLDQGPASVGRLIAFWVLLRQQLLNNIFSAVDAKLCHVVKKEKKVHNTDKWSIVTFYIFCPDQSVSCKLKQNMILKLFKHKDTNTKIGNRNHNCKLDSIVVGHSRQRFGVCVAC